MLGNDIIDLEEVLHSGQAKRVGFQERICTLAELSPLQRFFSRELSIWILWALKESAYKCYIQAGGLPVFAPKKFTVAVETISELQVSAHLHTPVGQFKGQIQVNSTYLIAESWRSELALQPIHRGIQILNAKFQKEKSILLKQAFCQHFSKSHQVDIGELEVRKDHLNVPAIYLAEEKLPYTLSLSHHGSWGLFSYRNENSPFLG